MPDAPSGPEPSGGPEVQRELGSDQSDHGPEPAAHSAPPSDAESRRSIVLREVREFLAGGATEVNSVDTGDKECRKAVADELLSVITGSSSNSANTQSDPGFAGASTEATPGAVRAAQDRARQLFLDHGYFDEAIDDLRAASSPADRALAAHRIGSVGNRLGNVHLIAALFDDAQEVRDAATAALAQLGDPTSSDASATPLPPHEQSGATERVSLMDALESAEKVDAEPQPVLSQDNQLTKDNQSQDPQSDSRVNDESLPKDEANMLLEEAAARKALADLQLRLDDTASSRLRLEREAEQRLESEARLSAEAVKRRREEDEQRQRAEGEVSQRRLDDAKRLAEAQTARVKAEEEAQRFAQEDAMLRLEVSKLRLAAEEIARARNELQSERRVAAERARLAEAQTERESAEVAHKAEMERLRTEEEALGRSLAEAALRRSEVEAAREKANQETLRLAGEKEQLSLAEIAREAESQRLREAQEKAQSEQERLVRQVEAIRATAAEVAARRAEVESARERAAQEAEQLAEAQARMKAAAEARRQAEVERAGIESELLKKAEEGRRLLDETRLRAEEERQRMQAEENLRATEQEQRLSQLSALRALLDREAQRRGEQERQISAQIESLRLAEMQARKRIEDAEVRRRKSEESYRLVAEQTQRFEVEARKSEIAEAQVMARLEEVRRNVAIATHSAAEQEKRIKEETELLRQREDAQRQRIEEAARSRAEAENRLQQEKARLQAEEEARLRASERFNLITAPEPSEAGPVDEWRDDPAENLRPSLRPVPRSVQSEPTSSFGAATAPAAAHPFAASASIPSQTPRASDERNLAIPTNGPPVAHGTFTALVSREDAFSRITKRFDDPSPEVRSAAARELRELDPSRMVESFTRALEEASPERRSNIGGAIASSGLAGEVIDMLGGESREETYTALCLLLAMAKTGEVQPLVTAIETHDNVYVRIAAVRLLTLNGQEEIANAAARRRLEGKT